MGGGSPLKARLTFQLLIAAMAVTVASHVHAAGPSEGRTSLGVSVTVVRGCKVTSTPARPGATVSCGRGQSAAVHINVPGAPTAPVQVVTINF